jgi:hypothetical protein
MAAVIEGRTPIFTRFPPVDANAENQPLGAAADVRFHRVVLNPVVGRPF